VSDVTAVSAAPGADAPGARSALIRLSAAGFLAYCSYAICRTPLLPLFARELGAGVPLVGFVVGASTLTGILLKLPAGAWSDVLGRRPLLVTGALVFAALPFGYVAASTLGVLIALRFVHGSATAIFGPVASASLSDVAPVARRATWLSTYSTVQGAGQALGPILAGYLVAGGRFDLAFVSAGLIAVGAPAIVAGWPDRRPPGRRDGRWRQVARGVAEIARDRQILITSVAQAAQFALNGALNAFLPLYGREVLGVTVAQLGWLFGAQTLATLAARPLMGALSDRVGRRAMIVSGLAACSAAVLLVSRADSLPALFAAALVYAVGLAVTTAATGAYVTDLVHHTRFGAAHGVFGTIYDVGDALGPIGAGVLVAAVGYVRMFQVMAAAAIAVAVVFGAWSHPASRLTRRGSTIADS
jgi:MFS family permease